MRARFGFVQQFFLLLCGAVSLVCASCADSEPDLVVATGAMVFDYATDEDFPASRLAVFIQTESEVQRVASILVENKETGYRWNITAPKLLKSGDKQWACYTNLLPPENERIPTGLYGLQYTDAAGEEAESSFMVSYSEKLFDTKSGDVKSVITSAKEESVALYDKNNVLIYFGKRKNNWNSNANILRDYNTAVTVRHCIAADSNRVVCLLPAEYLIEQPKEETDSAGESDE